MESRKGSITADCHQRVNPVLFQVVKGLLAPFLASELLAPCRFQNGSSPLNNVPHGTGTQLHNVAGNHAFVALCNSKYFLFIKYGRTHHGADGGIHAWSITAGGKNPDF